MKHGWRMMIMNNKAYDLSSYSFQQGEKILLDTNIWLYLFPAPTNSSNNYAKKYSKAFSNLLSAKAQPVLDSMILSEYLNRYIRIEWAGNYKLKYPIFKDFRKSYDFFHVGKSAEIFANKILSFCEIHSISANELDLKKALAGFSLGKVDFNDAILVEICKKRDLKLMTNDGDFLDGGIEVLTANKYLLKFCL